jgi:Resolvase, N terminal domain
MAAKPHKSRPNKMAVDLSDAPPHNGLDANRTKRRRAMNVGYARTSTTDQAAGLEAQERDLKAAGAERVFAEQVSSVAKRTKLAECLSFLRDGGVLTVTNPSSRIRRPKAVFLATGGRYLFDIPHRYFAATAENRCSEDLPHSHALIREPTIVQR